MRITCLLPDPAGLLWVATDRGAFRYDGYQAVPLNDLVTTGPHLPVGRVGRLALAAGQLWLGTDDGLYAYTFATNRLRAVPLPPQPGGRSVTALRRHPVSGRLWVGYGLTEAAIVALDPRLAATPALFPPVRHAGQAFDLVEAPAGGMWSIWPQPHHPERLDSTGQLRERLPNAAVSWVRGGSHEQLLTFSPTGWLTVPHSGGRWRLARTTLLEQESDKAPVVRWRAAGTAVPHDVLDGLQVDSTWYWWSTEQLVAMTWHRGGRPPRLTTIDLPASFRNGYFRVVADPISDLLWCFNPSQQGCYKRRLRPARAHALSVAGNQLLSTRALARLPDGRMLVGSYDGTFVQAADSPAAPLRPIPQLPGVVRAVLRTRAGALLVANEYQQHGIFGALDSRTLAVTPFDQLATLSTTANGFCLLEDHAGRVWGGSSEGLYQLDPVRGRATRYRNADATFPLHTCRIEQLAEAPAGVLWLATSDGLFRLDIASGHLTRYAPDEPAARRLLTAAVQCLAIAHPDSIWLGTLDQGLLLLHPARGVLRQLTPAQGLPSEAVSAVLSDPRPGILWVATYAGLARYQVRTGQMAVFSTADGLAAAELNRSSALRDPRTGRLYFGGVGGVSVLDPAQPFAPPNRPHLLLTRLTQHHADQDTVLTAYPSRGAHLSSIHLGPRDLFAELTFALTDYEAPVLARYAWRLVGGPDRRFRPLGATHSLRLQNLPAGDYVVEVRGETRQGVAASNLLRMSLTVTDLWWRRPWAWALGALLLAGLVYEIQRARIRRLLREQKLRSRIAADLHDEVGALLVRVNLQTQVIQAAGATPSQLDELFNDSRAAVTTMRDVVWSIDAQSDTVGALLDRMRDHLDHIADNMEWQTTLDVQGLPDAEALPPQVRQQLYLIFKEAVTNVVRHGQQVTRLDVGLRRRTGHLTLEVRNDGAVISTPPSRAGLGLRSMTHRTQVLGGTFSAGPRAAGGYEVRVVV